ncbi:MAG: aminotransferase class V-fold PLP-dependent enzyme [Planctomycetota bacterium]
MLRRSFLQLLTAASVQSIRPDRETAQLEKLLDNTLAPNQKTSNLPCPDRFGIESGFNYFNSGGLGPVLNEATKRQVETIQKLLPRVDHGHKLIDRARDWFAKFLGCAETELAFTRNATEGNSTIGSGLQLNPRDEVIIDAHAHQGGALAWMTRQKYEGIVVKAFEPCPDNVQSNLDRITKLLSPRTRVIQVSHVTAPTGIRLPVEEIAKIAKKHKLWFHIDGAQSTGMFPFTLHELGCDSFAGCGHKWLCGPVGTGFLYVKKDRLDDVQPTEVGSYAETRWTIPTQLEYHESARRFECGTRDPASIEGLIEAAKFQEEIGRDAIWRHAHRLASSFRSGLSANPRVDVLSPSVEPLTSAMITFRVQGLNCDQTFRALWKEGFRCRPVRERHLDAIRVSTHCFNSMQQCDRLLKAINRLSR